ncbi:hypothetical protein Tco_0725865 [Tanacetum coccineum]|uniref:Uncharacterized protein n=1 Tax=Tanacetum coccineum TaxID=301880 RepID=A0ABQ4YDW6_9ASTR
MLCLGRVSGVFGRQYLVHTRECGGVADVAFTWVGLWSERDALWGVGGLVVHVMSSRGVGELELDGEWGMGRSSSVLKILKLGVGGEGFSLGMGGELTELGKVKIEEWFGGGRRMKEMVHGGMSWLILRGVLSGCDVIH